MTKSNCVLWTNSVVKGWRESVLCIIKDGGRRANLGGVRFLCGGHSVPVTRSPYCVCLQRINFHVAVWEVLGDILPLITSQNTARVQFGISTVLSVYMSRVLL